MIPHLPTSLMSSMMLMGAGASGGGGGGWNPLNIPSLSEWFDFRVLNGTLADGDPISSLAGHKGLYTVIASGSTRPTWAANDGDSSPAMQFDGVNDGLSATINQGLLYGTTGTFEVWCVFRSTLSGLEGLFSTFGVNSPTGAVAYLPNGAWDTPEGSTYRAAWPASTIPGGASHVVRFVLSGARRLVQIDGATVVDVTTSSGTYSTGDNTLSVGNYAAAYYLTGSMRHLLFIKDAMLDDPTAAALNTYLGAAK